MRECKAEGCPHPANGASQWCAQHGAPLFTEEEEAMIARHEHEHDPLWTPEDAGEGRREWGVNEP